MKNVLFLATILSIVSCNSKSDGPHETGSGSDAAVEADAAADDVSVDSCDGEACSLDSGLADAEVSDSPNQ